MEQLIRTIAARLVDYPDEVRINVVEDEHEVTYELTVNPDDIGKIIGKQGRIVKAMRTVVQSAAAARAKRVNVEIMS